jgi:hypothetical protein
MAPRRIGTAYRGNIIGALPKLNGETIGLRVVSGSKEIEDFAADLQDLLKLAGLTVLRSNAQFFGQSENGTSAEVGTDRLAFIEALNSALLSAHAIEDPIRVTHSTIPGRFVLTVWPK